MITIVRPPSGNPDATPDEYWLLKRMFYGLWRSPWHWYDKINAILRSIGLTPSLKDPCLYTGFVHDPLDHLSVITLAPLSLGLNVDDFVYFSKDPAVKTLFCCLLAKHCKVDFMGIVLNGSLVFIFLGTSPILQLPSISTSLVLPQTSSRALPAKPTMRLQWLPRIDQVFQLILLHHLLMLMTLLRRSNGWTLIKVSSAALVGCPLLHALTSLPPTPSFPPT
jgi:hypothetical protein